MGSRFWLGITGNLRSAVETDITTGRVMIHPQMERGQLILLTRIRIPVAQRSVLMTEKHRTLYEYFCGKWSKDIPKPFKYNEKQMKKLKLDSPESTAVRYVREQPDIFTTAKIANILTPRYNRRKVRELPSIAMTIHRRRNIINEISEQAIFNVEFVQGMFCDLPWPELLKFMEWFSEGL